jgi:hypothetical protein
VVCGVRALVYRLPVWEAPEQICSFEVDVDCGDIRNRVLMAPVSNGNPLDPKVSWTRVGIDHPIDLQLIGGP